MASDAKGGGGSTLGQMAIAGLTAGANAITRGGPKRQYKYNKKMAAFQADLNRQQALFAMDLERQLRDEARLYDSPAAQMARYKEAGLNPNLIYGQGTPGNLGQTHAPSVQGVSVGQIDAASLGALGTEFNQARLMAAQTDLTRVRTDKTSYDKELTAAQTEVVRANPYLQKGYVESLVTQMKATADLKSQERDWSLQSTRQIVNGQDVGEGPARGYIKLEQSLRNLEQQFKLGELDQKVRAEVIQSKEFRNALDKVQVEWLRDGDITSQHIYQGIMMILQSLMRN